jgi:hypothetical protein
VALPTVKARTVERSGDKSSLVWGFPEQVVLTRGRTVTEHEGSFLDPAGGARSVVNVVDGAHRRTWSMPSFGFTFWKSRQASARKVYREPEYDSIGRTVRVRSRRM